MSGFSILKVFSVCFFLLILYKILISNVELRLVKQSVVLYNHQLFPDLEPNPGELNADNAIARSSQGRKRGLEGFTRNKTTNYDLTQEKTGPASKPKEQDTGRSKSTSDSLAAVEGLAGRQRIQCGEIRYPPHEDIQYRNIYWQLFEHDADVILLYSAYYDDRPAVGRSPLIRINALVRPSRNFHLKGKLRTAAKTGTYFCQVWYLGVPSPYVVEITVNRAGRNKHVHTTGLTAVYISCKLPLGDQVPTHVSISRGKCANASLHLPVYSDPQRDVIHEFGICVPAAFGTIPAQQFVEWVEFNRILGVTEFHVYNGSMTSDLLPVFGYYERAGLLHVHGLGSPLLNASIPAIKTASHSAMNDCMLRNMYRFRYVVVLDFDEIILPQEDVNYTQLLQTIDKTNHLTRPWPSYTFRNTFHFPEYLRDGTQPEFLRTMQYRYRQTPGAFLYRSKSFTDPRRCFVIFNHYCLTVFAGGRSPSTIDVNQTIALSHHYRSCPLAPRRCGGMIEQSDDFILRYKLDLGKRVLNILGMIGVV